MHLAIKLIKNLVGGFSTITSTLTGLKALARFAFFWKQPFADILRVLKNFTKVTGKDL